jgi:hypothetical protein
MEDGRKSSFCGTKEDSFIWCNSTDNTGLLFASIVWVTILYAATVCILTLMQGSMESYNGIIILALIVLALWAHLKTMLGDPGSVPSNAYPLQSESERHSMNISMCGRCDGYKPPRSHHGRYFSILRGRLVC